MAFNVWHAGEAVPSEELLRRTPNSLHRALYKRIRAFIKSDGLVATFDSLHAGRRNPELIARLGELTDMLTKLGCSASPYSKAFSGYEVTKNNTTFPELEPYRDLDPSRLVLAGKGHWDVTDFLSDQLVMAYREPESIKVDRTPLLSGSTPSFVMMPQLLFSWLISGTVKVSYGYIVTRCLLVAILSW